MDVETGVCQDWRMSWYAVSNWQQMWSGVKSDSLTLTYQHSWKGIWWDCAWIATGRSGFDTVVVNQYPFIRSGREQQISPM